MTAVSVVREHAIRVHFSDIYWLTVGADAVGEKIAQLQAMLYKQLAGKTEKDEEKDEQEWLQALVGAMVKKQRALVVLDDPWMVCDHSMPLMSTHARLMPTPGDHSMHAT